MIFRTFFLLFTASFRSRPPGPPAVPGVLEGVAAVIKLEDIAAIEKVEDAAEAVAGQAAYVGQHGQNNRQLLRRLLYFECLNAACLGKCQELLNFILLLSSNFYARPRYKA